MKNKHIYSFQEGSKEMKHLLGGKGANLSEMTNMGLPVPQGFTITTEACTVFYAKGKNLWEDLLKEVDKSLKELEETVGKKFSDDNNPLLVSVRSGSVVSMPGMMDTILNLGLNDVSVEGLAKVTNNERFAYDSYRRFIQMFSEVARDMPKVRFDTILESMKEDKKVSMDTELDAEDLKILVYKYKKVYKEELKEDFPQSPIRQLELAIKAVFQSWDNPRAKIYRKLNNIPDSLGTAVNVQAMVFGNMGDRSGTGVAFTRNPATGGKNLFGEYLINAQGEDVVAGIRTPDEIAELKTSMPKVYEELILITKTLEKSYRDMQDIEFTIEKEKLYILQTRSAKRTARATINIAVDLVNEGTITKKEAIMRVEPNQINQLLHPTFDEKALQNAEFIAKGLAASPGAATGKIFFNAEDVVAAKTRGEKAILVRQETSPEDIEGMISAEGILTSRGGMTSHAAVVARGMGKCCVAGCSDVKVSEITKTVRINNLTLTEGDFISLDGSTGRVYSGQINKVRPSQSGKFDAFMTWVDDIRTMNVRTNADSPKDALQALEFGAEGIGLCRTEHMFFEESRIFSVRKMILSNTLEDRKGALAELLPVQRKDFFELYEVMGERPVTVRLLDPPLHEFLPVKEEEITELAEAMNVTLEILKDRIEDLSEVNPMLGHRGCRLAVTFPEIYRMQTRAIIEAAIKIKNKGYSAICPEIMIPLVGNIDELRYVKKQILEEIAMVFEESNNDVAFVIGTMLEVPRAAITADEIAEEAEFFSFGTNDLSQMTYGFSRDDSGKFLNEYEDKGIIKNSPFEILDRDGVGKLMKIAIELGKKTRPDIHLGICGEHGGEPSSVEFCYGLGLDYVSCSPFRVPIAKLAVAQSVIKNE